MQYFEPEYLYALGAFVGLMTISVELGSKIILHFHNR